MTPLMVLSVLSFGMSFPCLLVSLVSMINTEAEKYTLSRLFISLGWTAFSFLIMVNALHIN